MQRQPDPKASVVRLTFDIEGTFASADFAPWIERHSAKLGLCIRFNERLQNKLSVHAEGPTDLLDALELACLLGPRDVWVHRIQRRA